MPQPITVKSILNKTKRRDPWFLDDYTINPYSGCSFNCLYCYIRGSKYGEHMEEKTSIKKNAVELLDKQLSLRARKQQYGFIVCSSATDPYLHFEKEEKLTRRILEVILKHRFPVHMITKSDLILRDIDILEKIDKEAVLPADLHLDHKAIITFSFSTINDTVSKIFEPGATPPSARLQALNKISENGFLCGVSMMPMLPYITDTAQSLEDMFSAFKAAGAHYVMPATITLFGNGNSDSKTLVLRAIAKHYPHLKEKYEKLFAKSVGLPAYYTSAFEQKMKELSLKYDLPLRIT
jgi:DNA repair photolyase